MSDQAEPFVPINTGELEAVLDLAGQRWLALVAEMLGRFPACSGSAIMAAAALAVAVSSARVRYHPDALKLFNDHLAADHAPWRLVTIS